MPHAVVLGGTGQIGRAVAHDLLDHGWSVALVHRGRRPLPSGLLARGARGIAVDRDARGGLGRALASGADLLVDAIAYGAEHAGQLLAVRADIGALVV